MRFVKSIVRWFFGFQAVGLIVMVFFGIFSILTAHPGVSTAHVAPTHLQTTFYPWMGYGIIVASAAFSAMFAIAWWTTRKPSAKRNMWAITASLLHLAEGVTFLVYVRQDGYPTHFGLDLIAVGAAGLFVFLRSEAAPDSTIAVPTLTAIAGDRTSVWTRHAVTALSYIAQIVAIVVWGIWANAHHLFRTRGLTWIALVVVDSILTTIVHECGHALIAWCFDMGVISFKAGPFQWAKREGKWAFKYHIAGLLTAGGAVGAIPTDPNQPSWEEILVIAAGPLANLLIGIPAIWAVMHDSWASYQQTWEFVAFTGSFCLIAAVLNLFPFMSEEGAYSDGARILQIVTHSPLDDYHRALAGVASTTITARRYRDLDIAAIERAATLFPREFRGLNLRLCACKFYEDSSRLSEASAALAIAESIYNDFSIELPGPMHTVFVIGHAYLNRDAAAARLWWDRMEAEKNERTDFGYWLAKTALNWIEGNLIEAEDAWQNADIEAQSLPHFGAYEFDRFRCAFLREELDNTSQAWASAPTSKQLAAPAVVLPVVAPTTHVQAVAPEAAAEIRPPSRPAISPTTIIPAPVGTSSLGPLTSEMIDQATARVLTPHPQIIPQDTPLPSPILHPPVERERFTFTELAAMSVAQTIFPTASTEVAAPLFMEISLPITTAEAVATLSEPASLPTAAAAASIWDRIARVDSLPAAPSTPPAPAPVVVKERFEFPAAPPISALQADVPARVAAQTVLPTAPTLVDPLPEAASHQFASATASIWDRFARLDSPPAVPNVPPASAPVVVKERFAFAKAVTMSPFQAEAPAMLSVETLLSTPPAAIDPLPVMDSFPLAPAPVAPTPEIALLSNDAAFPRGPISFTRIPATSLVASEPPTARIGVLPAALPSTGVPPPLNAPAVPAAFARRAVRPVPAPPSSPYAASVFAATPAPTLPASDQLAEFTPTSAEATTHIPASLPPIPAIATSIATAPISSSSLATLLPASVAPSSAAQAPGVSAPSSAPAQAIARFDPVESIRAAARESVHT